MNMIWDSIPVARGDAVQIPRSSPPLVLSNYRVLQKDIMNIAIVVIVNANFCVANSFFSLLGVPPVTNMDLGSL